jgi:hypothetical protein
LSSITSEEFAALEEKIAPLFEEEDYQDFVETVDDKLYPDYQLRCT